MGPPVSTFWLSRHQVPSSRVLYFFPMGAPLSILPLPPPLTPSVGLICYFLNASNLSFPTLATDLWLTPTSKDQWLEAQSLITVSKPCSGQSEPKIPFWPETEQEEASHLILLLLERERELRSRQSWHHKAFHMAPHKCQGGYSIGNSIRYVQDKLCWLVSA